MAASGKEVTKRVAQKNFDDVRRKLQVKRKRQGAIITQSTGSGVGLALRNGANSLRKQIARTRVFNALINEGRLSRELGLTPGARSQKPVAMVNFIANSLVARYSATPLGSRLQFRFQILVPTMERIVDNRFATYSYQGVGPTTRGSEIEISWLEWLLFEGNNIIIDGHAPMGGEPSRSNQNTIMNSQPSGAKSWAVPLAYQGTVDDNFITRSYDKVLPSIRREIRAAIRNAISGL